MRTPCFLGLGALLLAACSEYAVVQEESHYRYDAQADTLRILEIQRGLVAEDTEPALAALRGFVDGRRRYPPEGGLFTIDLDEEIEEEDRDDWGKLLGQLEPWVPNVRVEESALFRDDQGRLSAFRETRISDVRGGLELLSDAINAVLAEEEEDWARASEFPVFDEQTAGLWREHVDAGRPWFEVVDGVVALVVPTSDANAARCLEHLLTRSAEEPSLRSFFAQVTSLEVADGRALLRFGGGADGWVHFVGEPHEVEYDEGLAAALAEAGLEVDASLTLADIRARLDR